MGDLSQRSEDEELKNDVGRAIIILSANAVRFVRAIMLPEPEDQILQGRECRKKGKRFQKCGSIISSDREIAKGFAFRACGYACNHTNQSEYFPETTSRTYWHLLPYIDRRLRG